MAKNKNLIAGITFLLVSLFFIATTGPYFTFHPTQEVDLTNADFGPLGAGNLFIQEITLKKDYLNRVDMYIGEINNENLNEGVFLLFDSEKRILYSKRFTSRDIVKADFYPFEFNNPIKAGKGQKVYAALYSIDGGRDNHLAIPLNPKSTMGKFMVAPIRNNDIPASLENLHMAAPIGGSIGYKTFESDSVYFTFSRVVLYLFMIAIALGIIFARSLTSLVKRTRLLPHYAYLVIALIFGPVFLIITPPFQTPDEPVHFYRSFEISELNIFKYQDEVPQSLVEVAAIQERMKFKSWEKTSREEILSLAKIMLDPGKRANVGTLAYTLPYIPQALGIAIGKIFSLPPLWLLYMGRLFNLLFSCALIFIAIQLTPIHKWLFFLLAVMPMTISQVASVSYDALTISLSFLLIALIFNFAFNSEKVIHKKDIVFLFIASVLLALSKPPYFIIAFSFLIIPVLKFGNRKKYFALFAGLILSTLIVSQLWQPTKDLIQSIFVTKANAATAGWVMNYPDLKTGAGSFTSHDHRLTTSIESVTTPDEQQGQNPQGTQQGQQGKETQQEQQGKETQQGQQNQADTSVNTSPPPPDQPVNPFNPEAQKKFILDNPVRYIGIIISSMSYYLGLYMTSIVGLFGWNDTGLPDGLVYLFIFMILLTAMTLPGNEIKIGLLKRIIPLLVFFAGIIIIETGLYIYSNLPGADMIVGVQGRYFIPLAPLFLLLFYNSSGIIKPKYFSASKTKPAKGKASTAKKGAIGIPDGRIHLSMYFPWILIGFSLFALWYSIMLITSRFYIFTG